METRAWSCTFVTILWFLIYFFIQHHRQIPVNPQLFIFQHLFVQHILSLSRSIKSIQTSGFVWGVYRLKIHFIFYTQHSTIIDNPSDIELSLYKLLCLLPNWSFLDPIGSLVFSVLVSSNQTWKLMVCKCVSVLVC